MNGGGKSDKSIVPEMLSKKDCGIPQTAEKAEERDRCAPEKLRPPCRTRTYARLLAAGNSGILGQ